MADSGGYFLRLGRFCQAYGALAPPLDILLVGPERHHEGILNFMPMGKAVRSSSVFGLGWWRWRLETTWVCSPFLSSPTAVWIEKIRPRIGLLLSRVTDRKFTPVLFSLLGLIAPWGMGFQGEKG